MIKRARVLMQFGSVAGATQHQNRGADRGPQAGSPLGVVDATGSSPVIVKKRPQFHRGCVTSQTTRSLPPPQPGCPAGDPGPLLGSVVEWPLRLSHTASVPIYSLRFAI